MRNQSPGNQSPLEQTLDYIAAYIEKHGFPPTTREIAAGTGVASTSTVQGRLRKLEQQGKISYAHGSPRTIRLLIDW